VGNHERHTEGLFFGLKMARSRNIKPGFFTNDQLAELPALTRILFIGLWTIADREGRIEDRPKRIKAETMPYDDFDCNQALSDLQKSGFITRYVSGGINVIQVINWDKHQNPHVKEQPSTLPAQDKHQKSTVQAPDKEQPKPELAGLIPDSGFLIPDSSPLIPSSVPKGTGAADAAPTARDLVFANGVPLLTVAGVAEKNARSMLAGLCKRNGDSAVANALAECAKARPLEPVSWLQAVLAGKTPASKQQAIEDRNRAVADAWIPPELRGTEPQEYN
jgi:hypothetical protein